MISPDSRGFTLVELLIVIAILAVLAAATTVVLNPAELLAQSRDAQRLEDVEALQRVVSLYITQSNSINLGAGAAGGRCTADPGTGNGPFSTATCSVVSTARAVDGTGWVDVPLNSLESGSPVAKLPIDPTNSATYFYAYKNNNTNHVFEVDTRLESKKHRGRMASDGGDRNACVTFTESSCFYETGNAEGLAL